MKNAIINVYSILPKLLFIKEKSSLSWMEIIQKLFSLIQNCNFSLIGAIHNRYEYYGEGIVPCNGIYEKRGNQISLFVRFCKRKEVLFIGASLVMFYLAGWFYGASMRALTIAILLSVLINIFLVPYTAQYWYLKIKNKKSDT
ncbi:MAG: hypothetical protein UR93_C0019G0008 [Berkelbacteria bacterium GW2011_GWA2_35_9]|uniref:Uncharacterized protein n=1 Tax=Berkelbacteria bacterium GW2011_GWA2_35_9 TaxID=1618333 RepID=A0A0G0D4K4_9BACT|nr:MAG: hypothetical protein UR93_C0019G0008 [Berkelbacteria bacterium GW2011_GWA2_35_9]